MKRHINLAVAAGLLIVLAGCSGSKEPAVAEVEAPAKIVPVPANSFVIQWKAPLPLDGKTPRRLDLNDETVFASLSDNRCFWINRAAGNIMVLNAAARSNETLFGPLTLGERVVFPATGRLRIFDRRGRQVDEIELHYAASSGAIGEGTTVLIGIDHPKGGRIAAIDIKPSPYSKRYEMTTEWEVMAHGQVVGAPALYQGLVFFGARDGGVYAVRATTAGALWPRWDGGHYPTNGPIVADVKADKDGVYVSSMNSQLYCLDLNDGHRIWSYYAGVPLRAESSPIVTSAFIYLHVPGGAGSPPTMVAIDKAGKQEIRAAKWVVENAVQFLSHDEKCVYLRGSDNSLMAVDKFTGEVLFRSQRSDYALFATNTSTRDNTIYAVSKAGVVCAIKPVFQGGHVGEVALEAGRVDRVASAK